jgi:hypothetical protein
MTMAQGRCSLYASEIRANSNLALQFTADFKLGQ